MVRASAAMMPRLLARERLDAINDQALAAGALPKADMRWMIRSLELAANGGKRARAAKASPAVLAAMGIATIAPPAEKAPSDG